MTWGQLKQQLREEIWPDGESPNLVKSHDKSFLDAIIDLQSVIPCLQYNNTSVFPHCATYYRCGLTLVDSAPRANAIHSLTVTDKIDPDTGLESAEADEDFCGEVEYSRVNYCHIKSYLQSSQLVGCCLPIPTFFGLSGCTKGLYPIPTDEDVPAGLAMLPLGLHYPQESTNRSWGRAGSGVWALERGQIWVAPWINSTETIRIKWDGIKRIWTDADPLDEDPMLSKAIRLYVQSQHTGEWDREWSDAQEFRSQFIETRVMLIRQCREETRQRMTCGMGVDEGGGSHARAANGVTEIFYNDEQSASASCPDGQTGDPVNVTIPAGTVGSALSKADANARAQQQALSQATAQLVCEDVVVTYENESQTYTASCTQESGAPIPEGTPVTVTVHAGEVTSTVSQEAANEDALALAQSRAQAQITCKFWNRSQTANLVCATNGSITAEETTPAHTYSSTVSQTEADSKALAVATNVAQESLETQGCGVTRYWNTYQFAIVQLQTTSQIQPGQPGSGTFPFGQPCVLAIKVNVAAHLFSSTESQAAANLRAKDAAQIYAEGIGAQKSQSGQCGAFVYDYNLAINE